MRNVGDRKKEITYRDTCNQLKLSLTKRAEVHDRRPIINAFKAEPEDLSNTDKPYQSPAG